MKPKLTTFAASMIIGGLAATGPALGIDMSSLPPVQVQGVVSYITGGIGEDEVIAFRHAAAAYPLELQFAQKARPRDVFLSDVKVTIRDRSGRMLLDTTTEGPFLLAQLPAGKYRVEADFRGELKHQAVEIHPGKRERAVFVWVTHDEESS